MKIKKIEKKTNNLYKITLSDNTSLSFYDETIIKFDLLFNKDLSKEIIDDLIIFNNKIDGYYKMINYIKKKLRTEKEIKDKLKNLNYSLEEIDFIINKLKLQKYIDDAFYVDAYINNQINLTLNGPNKIIYDLSKLGINEGKLYVDNINDEIWQEKVKKVADKYVKVNHNYSKNMLIIKLKNYLVNLGYDVNKYNDIIQEIKVLNENKVMKKEYDKIKKRYEKKYNGKELELKIKDYLYKKGFKINIDNMD